MIDVDHNDANPKFRPPSINQPTMKYTSTRDATKFYTFEEALFSGYARDGGLFVPEQLPNLLPPSPPSPSSSSSSSSERTKSDVLADEWSKLGYVELATEILHPFIGHEVITKSELKSLLERALTGFDTTDENLVPVVPIIKRNNSDNNKIVCCYVAELFHGPTYCFKVRKKHRIFYE